MNKTLKTVGLLEEEKTLNDGVRPKVKTCCLDVNQKKSWILFFLSCCKITKLWRLKCFQLPQQVFFHSDTDFVFALFNKTASETENLQQPLCHMSDKTLTNTQNLPPSPQR